MDKSKYLRHSFNRNPEFAQSCLRQGSNLSIFERLKEQLARLLVNRFVLDYSNAYLENFAHVFQCFVAT